MLYTENDYNEIKQLTKKFWMKILIATLIYIAIIVVCSITRIDWLGYAASVVWGIFVVFSWGTQGARIRKYYLFLKDINEGLEKEITGSVKEIDSSITSRDLVDFYTVIFNDDAGDPESPSRKLYFDASKGLPDINPGDNLKLTLFGNNIKGFQKI
jgi:hypothetical protein